MTNLRNLALLAVLSSLSIGSWAYAAWTYSTNVGNGDLISAEKWNSLVAQLIAVSVQSDWNANSGYAQILNKHVIPAAQVNTDWNAASGVAQILNKPAIPAAQVSSDWNAASGVAQILNKPVIPAAQVNSDWNATSGAAQILNKPWGVSGGNVYMSLAGNVGIGTVNPQKPLDIAASGGLRLSQSAFASATNEIFFQDNGQLRSADDNHRIIFDRANNTLELREYGAIVLSPGATSGARTQKVTFSDNGNVGIGTTSPGGKLDVAGTIKATKLNISGGSHFKMNLTHCGGACSGSQTLSAWVSLAGYTWSLVYNSDPANFVKSGGNVTVNESGVYMIRLQAMAIPTAATSYMGAAYYFPYINGSANCLGDVGLERRYGPAGYWSQGRREYVSPLSAGTTISYGMYTMQAMDYWGHDSYTSLEITRIN